MCNLLACMLAPADAVYWCGRKLEKHGREIARMASAEHQELVPLVEVSLAIMRLACEKFFVLISVLATYLLFRDEAPRPARLLIRLNHRLSVLFQRVRIVMLPQICTVNAQMSCKLAFACMEGVSLHVK